MKSTRANDAAFPRPCGTVSREETNLEQDGMTMREWYAGEALNGLTSEEHLARLLLGGFDPDKLAEVCFRIADAMLAQAKKP